MFHHPDKELKKKRKKITTIILKATRTKLKRKPPLVLRDIENIPYVPQFLNLHFEFDAHTFTYKGKNYHTYVRMKFTVQQYI